jgi:transposase
MTEKLTITNERVDDIPLLLAQMDKMGLQPLLDKHFPTHGNWLGLSLGWVTVIWLTHILSMGDHRLNHVEEWADRRLHTLGTSVGQDVEALDFSDDRLSDILWALSRDKSWGEFESELNGHLVRVYDLKANRVRLDATTASGYGSVTKEGLFQFGHSKAHRPDLPQVKVMLSTLDPLGMPLVTEVVSGEKADDPLYRPSIERVRASLGLTGLLYVGDCKMASMETRASIHQAGDFYLTPLPATQISAEQMEGYLQPYLCGAQKLTDIYRTEEEGKRKLIAQGYETEQKMSVVMEGKEVSWRERRLVVYSLSYAEASKAGLNARISNAEAAVRELNGRGRGKKRFTDLESLQQAAERILDSHRARGLLQLSFEKRVSQKPVRRYGNSPARTIEDIEVSVSVTRDKKAVEAAEKRLGWRVYATNHPEAGLSLGEAVMAYRHEYIIERAFGRLKGKHLSLTPMYLETDEHATGLIRLLSIGLRVLTLLEFVVRSRLSEQKAKLEGLYAGSPKRKTAQPTAERLLEAFKDITLTGIHQHAHIDYHLTSLSDLQERILRLLDFDPSIYSRLSGQFPKPG